MNSVEIIPAIIPQSLEGLKQLIGRVRGADVRTIQVDVTDGVFVESRSWPMNRGDMKSFEPLTLGDEGLPYWEEFNFEVDLMVHHPEKYLAQWVGAGVSRAVIHIGTQHNFIECQKIAGDSVELGMAFDLDVPYKDIASSIPQVSYVQVMGIAELGKQGEPFDERAVALIKKIKTDFPDTVIQVDGGVSLETASVVVNAGATRLAVGSALFNSSDIARSVSEFKTRLKEL